jgi:hypothetical protein
VTTTGTRAYGVLVLDRDTGLSHRMHDTCLDHLSDLLTDAGVNPMSRLVPMGPGTTDPGDTCDLTGCTRPMGGTGGSGALLGIPADPPVPHTLRPTMGKDLGR